MTARGFFALEAVAMDRTNPMSRNRRGLNLGEAAVLFVMARERGGIQLAGGGESSDAHHMSAPSPDGSGAEAAMRAALAQAGARADEILYVNLHGTGTPLNDSSESAAVHRVFGADVPCSSTKPRVGHTLGAAGALEAAFCAMTLESERDGELALPPHDWDRERDPELAPLRLAGPGETARARGRRLALSNGFGFGGNNCTLVLERCEP
jgi:3-oxoacyl-[acyl-carrier-protein] synthase-1